MIFMKKRLFTLIELLVSSIISSLRLFTFKKVPLFLKRREFSLSLIKPFTLIELLVVIAIIAILAALLLPALKSAKERGNRSVCTGNMKNLSYAFASYCNNNDDFFPMHYRYDGEGTEMKSGNAPAKNGWNWAYELSKNRYVNNESWRCPTAQNTLTDSNGYSRRNLSAKGMSVASWTYVTYGYNFRYFGDVALKINTSSAHRPVRAGEIKNTQAIYLMETSKRNGTTQIPETGDFLFYSTSTKTSPTYATGYHKKSSNTLRGDGSVGNIDNPEINLHLGHNPAAIWLLNWKKI